MIYCITTPRFTLSMREPLLSISSIITAGLRGRLRELDSDDMGEDPLDATDGRRAVPGEVPVCQLPPDNMMLGSAHSRGQTPRAQQNGTAKEQQGTCGTLIPIFTNDSGRRARCGIGWRFLLRTTAGATRTRRILAENVLSLTRRGSFLFFPISCSV